MGSPGSWNHCDVALALAIHAMPRSTGFTALLGDNVTSAHALSHTDTYDTLESAESQSDVSRHSSAQTLLCLAMSWLPAHINAHQHDLT